MYRKFILEIIHDKISDCTKCDLHKNRFRAVPGEGSLDAALMCVAQAPGKVEDETGRPLVGPAGVLFGKWLKAINIKREDIFITNTVKCYPPRDRAPQPDELKACRWYLDQQLDIIEPKILFVLGAVALKAMTGDPNISIMRERGRWLNYNKIPMLATFHPSYLLRSMTEDTKKKVESDLIKLRDRYNSLNGDLNGIHG